jgi:hypothetical protein
MLDPRIYRTGLVVVALAAMVLAFSLGDQHAPLGASLAPEAFNGQDAYATMTRLATEYPNRRPGSPGDTAIAGYVAGQLRSDGFAVSTDSFSGRTPDGTRRLQVVTGSLAGLSSGSIVVVAHRDALQAPGTAEASGTAVLLELARDLSGETQPRSIVLASTSGSAGATGAAEVAKLVPGPVDAVIALGDLAGTNVHQPVLVPWSNTPLVAPTMLRNTVAAILNTQAGLPPGASSLGGQFLHLALPIATTEQAPFVAAGEPAVELSLSGQGAPAPHEPTSEAQITALGRTMLQTVGALSGATSVSAPSAYLVISGKLVPAWGIRLLILALILPVLGATIDGLARARRRGASVGRWLVWVLATGLPFAIAAVAVRFLGGVGLIAGATPNPIDGGALRIHGSSIAIMVVLAAVVAVGFAWLRPWLIRRVSDERALHDLGSPGASAALMLVLCLVAIAIWLSNPFTAALILPALHLWMWAAGPQDKPRRSIMTVLILGGLVLPAVAVVYYADTLGLSAAGAVWSAVLQLAGGSVGLGLALEGSLLLGCLTGLALIMLRAARQPKPEEVPITVRGPISYAGPGSLGGTGSALRR